MVESSFVAVGVFLFSGGLVIYYLIYPNFFKNSKSRIVEASSFRPPSLLINYQRGICEVKSRWPHDDGSTTYQLQNKDGLYEQTYRDGEVVDFSKALNIVGQGNPLYIDLATKTKMADSLVGEFAEMKKSFDAAVRQRDDIEDAYDQLKANFNAEVKSHVDKVLATKREEWKAKAVAGQGGRY